MSLVDSLAVGLPMGKDWEGRARRRKGSVPVSSRSRILAVERERSRIAKDLHAGAGQPLAGIKMNLALLDELASLMPVHAGTTLNRLRALTEEALSQVRTVSHRLHPPDWQAFTLEEALRRLVADMGVQSAFPESNIEIKFLPVRPDHSVMIAAYRCAQECLSNAFRHSHATRVDLLLESEGSSILLRISDNGIGISGQTGDGCGLGLRAIRENVADVDGHLRVFTGQSGTTMDFLFPVVEWQGLRKT